MPSVRVRLVFTMRSRRILADVRPEHQGMRARSACRGWGSKVACASLREGLCAGASCFRGGCGEGLALGGRRAG